MQTGIWLSGRTSRFQVEKGEAAQVDICLSVDQEYQATPISFSGKVIDRKTCLPIAEAHITLRNGPYIYKCATSRDGSFELSLPRWWSTASIQISREGYDDRYIGTYLLFRPDHVFCLSNQ